MANTAGDSRGPDAEPVQTTGPVEAAGLSPQQLAEAKQYGRLDLCCTLADKALDLAFLGVVAGLLARPLDAWLQSHRALHNASLRLVAMSILLSGLGLAVSFPLSYYAGYRLEHRFKLSTLSFRGWLWRYAKRVALGVALSLPLVLGLYWLIWTVHGWWWLAAAGGFFLVSIVVGQLAPVLILPLFYKIERLAMPEVADRIERLAAGTGLSIEGVYRIALSDETVKANAMLAGLGRTRRVLLGDTLLDGFSADEIAVIFAHEIGHHVHRHIRKMIAGGLAVSTAGFWVCDRLLGLTFGGPAGLDYAGLPVATLPLALLTLTAVAMALEPLQNLVSRHFERQSDRYALERTGDRAAYRSAFCKLARLNKDDPDPPWLEVALFHSHPPIAERLALAECDTPAGPAGPCAIR